MRSTFKVLFYLKKNAPKKNGSVPVMCRITIDGTIAQFSCKCDILPDLWDIKSNRASGKSTVALETNRLLDKIRVGINAKYKEIAERDNYVTAEKVKNAFLGLEMRHETLLKVFAQHNEDFFKQVDAGLRCPSTYHKYCTVYKHLEEFIKNRYRVSDIALKELTPAFITDFDIFLRTEKQCCNNTVWIYMMPLRRMITIAQNHGWIVRDPFVDYSISAESTDRDYLTKDEIRRLLDLKFRRKSMELARDLYVFCCFTGLSKNSESNNSEDSKIIIKDFYSDSKISKDKNGMIDVKEINYMQKSLTGVELDFSDVVDKTVDIKQASDNLSSGTLSGYKYEPVENGAVITGILDTGIKNEDEGPWSGRRKVKVYLVKNPESCFDAFTISSLSSINIEN